MNDDLYKELELQKGASPAEIKKAYRNLAKKYHPDTNKDNPDAEDKFKKISAAYAVLSDKKKKDLYDKYGSDGLRDGFDPTYYGRNSYAGGDFGGFSGFGGMESIFETLFGGGGGRKSRRSYSGGSPFQSGDPFGGASPFGGSPRGMQKGQDVKTTLKISLLDSVIGRELDIIVPVGSDKRNLKVKIPPGIKDGKNIRLKNQGALSNFGGPSGDLILEINIADDPVYERKGDNLITHQQITLAQAYYGDKINVVTPWGKGNLTLPPLTQGGSKLRVKGHGIRTANSKGDLIVVFNIKIPAEKSDELSELVDKMESYYQNVSRETSV
ncbi:MAG: DnaJ domain-containing protein [Deltaproteobacteria bacterium]|nr:DnaJ domain-containing protein [Deltaproteobacteria bacterium]